MSGGTVVRAGAVMALGGLLAVAPLQGAQPADGAKMALGRKVFTEIAQPTCRTCHALGDIEAVANIGASLEELKPDAKRVADAVTGGIGVMPAYRDKLSAAEIEAVAMFVSRTTGGAK